MADHRVVECLAIPHVNARCLPGVEIVDKEVYHRIGSAGLGVRFYIQRGLHLGLVHAKEVVLYRQLVEAEVGDLCTGRIPPHRRGLPQLLAVYPRSRAVLDAFRLAAIGGDGQFVRTRAITHVQVAIAIEGLVQAVGRNGQ